MSIPISVDAGDVRDASFVAMCDVRGVSVIVVVVCSSCAGGGSASSTTNVLEAFGELLRARRLCFFSLRL